MSKPCVIQKLLIVLVGIVLASLSVTAFIATGDEPSVSSISPGLPTVLLAANDSCGPVEPPDESPNPPPGVYRSTLDMMWVMVPRPIDEQMVIGIGHISRFKMPVMKPEARLEPIMLARTAP
jgi:hypothetical protein